MHLNSDPVSNPDQTLAVISDSVPKNIFLDPQNCSLGSFDMDPKQIGSGSNFWH